MPDITYTTSTPEKAWFIIGQRKGYKKKQHTKDAILKALQRCQRRLKKEQGITLSAEVSKCRIVCEWQSEPSVKLSFIQYPLFPMEKENFKQQVKDCAAAMLRKLKQNRIVICFDDQHVMLEVEPQKIDDGITPKKEAQ
jgi:hypothetical protein